MFLGQQTGLFGSTDHEHHGETGLLLFVIPGAIASYLSSRKRLLCPLLGALYALPLCLLIRHFWLTPSSSFWQELAYATSAVFWCVFGAMLMLFALGLLQTLQQLHRRQRYKKGALSAFLSLSFKNLLEQVQVFFGVSFEIGATADVLLIQKICGTVSTGLPTVFSRSALVMPSAWMST